MCPLALVSIGFRPSDAIGRAAIHRLPHTILGILGQLRNFNIPRFVPFEDGWTKLQTRITADAFTQIQHRASDHIL